MGCLLEHNNLGGLALPSIILSSILCLYPSLSLSASFLLISSLSFSLAFLLTPPLSLLSVSAFLLSISHLLSLSPSISLPLSRCMCVLHTKRVRDASRGVTLSALA